MYRITLLLLFLASNCAGIKGKDFFRWSTSSSSSSVTSAPGTPTSDEPPEKCECLDGTSLQDDVDKILNKLDAVLRQETNLTILPHISSKLSAIQTAVQDKTCQCQNGDALLELEENTNNIIKNILQFANDSSTCACNNTNLIYNITETMLARLKSLGDLSGATHNIVKTCDTEMAEIKHKLDIIIKEKGHGGGKCDLSELEQDLNHIIYLLETILRRILEIIQRGCPCKEEIKELEKKICDKIDSVMEKLDENADSNGCNLDSIKEILEKMDKKLDKITGGNIASTTINQCNCITYKQFIEIIPLYCVKQQRDKKGKKTATSFQSILVKSFPMIKAKKSNDD